MFFEIMLITAPVFLLGTIGFVWARVKVPYDLAFVSRMTINISLPCLIFSTLSSTNIAPAAIAEIAWASLLAYVAAMVGMWAILRLTGLSQRTWWTASIFGNTGNIGLPLCLFAFGEEGLALGMVVFAISVVFQFSIGLRVIAGAGQMLTVLRQPMVYAAALGVAFGVMNWPVPEVLLRTMSLAGQIAIPLMLITLGVSIAQLEVGQTGRAAFVALARLLALGGAGVIAGLAFSLDKLAFGVLVLQLITPAAVTVYLMTSRYGTEPGAVAGLVLITTLLALVVIPVALPFLL